MLTEKKGYIFNKYEVIYISGLMGANYLFGSGFNSEESPEKTAEYAKKSLLAKNYVFTDYNGNMILNEELIDYFSPFVSPEKIIALSKNTGETEESVIYYLKKDRYVSVETDSSNRENYIFTLNKNPSDVEDDICEYFPEEEELSDRKMRFFINRDEYIILNSLSEEGDDEKIKSHAFGSDIESLSPKEIRELFGNNKKYISLSFFYDYKNNPACFAYLLYYFTEKGCWQMESEKSYGDNIKYTSVTAEEMMRNTADMLYKLCGIKVKNSPQLFI